MTAVDLLGSAVRLVDGLARLGMAVAGLAVVAMMALITVEVAGRNLVGVSTLIADEYAGYLLVVITFLGVARSLATGAFVRVEFLYGRLAERSRASLDVALAALALAFVAVLDWYLWQFTLASYRFGTSSIYFTQTPLWIPQAAMAVGGLVLALQLAAELGRAILARLGSPLGR